MANTPPPQDNQGDEPAPNPVTPALVDPINVRSTALAVLAVLAVIYFLNWAQAVLLPLVFSVLLSYALDPVVTALHRLHIHRAIGAALVLSALVALLSLGTLQLKDQMTTMLDKIPEAVKQLQRSARHNQDPDMIDKAQEAAHQIQKATEKAYQSKEDKTGPGVMRVKIEKPVFNLRDYILGGSINLMVLGSQALTVLLLVYFLLAVGNLYKRKLVKITGPTLTEKKITVTILDEFNLMIRRFLFVMLIGGIFVGVVTWLAFLWLGVEQAALWGLIAGIASAVPYLGPAMVMIGTAVAGLLQFHTLSMAAIISITSLIITSIQGNLLTPWMTSQASSLNAVTIFLGLLFWGWLWGPVGLVVATPILLIIKAVCDHIENLRSVGELLGK